MRGKGLRMLPGNWRRRITPACAGKSAAIPVTRRCGRNHPRICGEKIYSVRDNIAEQGSPPRMRGKGDSEIVRQCSNGITPAYAGKSEIYPAGTAGLQDHPRMCGEKRPLARWAILPPGSPPHVRGKEVDTFGFPRGYGITPACAGKSAYRNGLTSKSEGSPPHVRGKV